MEPKLVEAHACFRIGVLGLIVHPNVARVRKHELAEWAPRIATGQLKRSRSASGKVAPSVAQWIASGALGTNGLRAPSLVEVVR